MIQEDRLQHIKHMRDIHVASVSAVNTTLDNLREALKQINAEGLQSVATEYTREKLQNILSLAIDKSIRQGNTFVQAPHLQLLMEGEEITILAQDMLGAALLVIINAEEHIKYAEKYIDSIEKQ